MITNLNFTHKKSITKITKKCEIIINKRFTGSKKFLEEINQKCIGIDCSNTRPFFPQKFNNKPNTTIVSNNVSEIKTNAVETLKTKSKIEPLSHNFDPTPLTTKANNIKQITSNTVPEESFKDKLERVLPLENRTCKSNHEGAKKTYNVFEEKKPQNMTEIVQHESINPIEDVTLTVDIYEVARENYNNVLEHLNGIFDVNKKLNSENVDSLKPSKITNFSEIFATNLLNNTVPESQVILKNLEMHGFITYDDYGYIKVTEKLYKNQDNKQLETMKIDLDILKQCEFEFEICTLIINEKTTVVASGIQKHAVITITLNNDYKIIMGFLTSDKTDILNNDLKKVLSHEQPFDKTSGKEQMYAILNEPLIVKTSYTKQLPIKYQTEAIEYLQQTEVLSILKNSAQNHFINKLETNNGFILIYDGNGFTKQELITILEDEKQIMEKMLKKHMKQYKELQFKNKNKNKVELWLKNIKAVSSIKYIELLEDAMEKEK